MSQYRSTGICHKNKNGGYYIKGDYYNYATKKAVVDKFFEMWEALYPLRPSYNDVAIHMKVSKQTVKNFVNEYFSYWSVEVGIQESEITIFSLKKW